MKSNNIFLNKASKLISKSEAILITAGAGMGVDSGLPDFRGAEGFWKSYPPYKKLGLNFYDMANPRTFSTDPNFAWGFYSHRLNLYRKTNPHIGFKILKKWADRKEGNYFIFTSNVDGQFQKAGFDENRIEECHGSIHYLQCTIPCTPEIKRNNISIKIDPNSMRVVGKIPKCSGCGSAQRPNILMFGDSSWIPSRTEFQHKNLTEWILGNKNRKITIIELGAGTSVPTVRYFSENISQNFNADLIRINPDKCETTGIPVPLTAKEALVKLDNLI